MVNVVVFLSRAPHSDTGSVVMSLQLTRGPHPTAPRPRLRYIMSSNITVQNDLLKFYNCSGIFFVSATMSLVILIHVPFRTRRDRSEEWEVPPDRGLGCPALTNQSLEAGSTNHGGTDMTYLLVFITLRLSVAALIFFPLLIIQFSEGWPSLLQTWLQ